MTLHLRRSLPSADSLVGVAVCSAALGAYLGTLAPGLSWANQGADGGDLITAAMTWGVPHPSGYPTWVLIGRLIALLPLGNVAWRFNLYSALAAAAATGTLYATSLLLAGSRPGSRHRLICAAAALSFAFGRTLWSQAVITEVYALSALCAALPLYLALRSDLSPRPRYWAALGLTVGVGLGAHLTLLLALPGLVLLVLPALRRAPRRALAAAAGLLAGLAVYAYLPLAGAGDSPVIWGMPSEPAGFWWLVSGRLYRGYAFGLPLAEWPARLQYWARLWGAQAGWHTLALALLGARLTWEDDHRRGVAFAFTFAMYTVFALGYATPDSTMYLIPAFLVAALWTARGLAGVWTWLAERLDGRGALRTLCGAALSCAVAAWPLGTNWARVDASADHQAQDWLRHMAEALPEGALVITGDDRHTFALAYQQWVEEERPDLLVVDGDLWNQPWYARRVASRLGHTLPDAGIPLAVLARRAAIQRPVVLTTWRAEVADGMRVSSQEGFWLLSPQGSSHSAVPGGEPRARAARLNGETGPRGVASP